MSHITLRDVPQALDRRLRELARTQNKSLNKTIIQVLIESLHLGDGNDRQRDVSDLAGTWSNEQAAEFEANTRVFDQLDNIPGVFATGPEL